MSQAFIKETDGDEADDLPELPLSPHPNYVTTRGLAQLQARVDAVTQRMNAIQDDALDATRQRALLARELRWLQARIGSALEPDVHTPDRVGFGASVELLDEDERRYQYQIVGEDEAAPEQGLVSWLSPLAVALKGAREGDEVIWQRPAGDLVVEVLGISYPAD
jgi:transcription elongation GreA/GreB family factor